MIISNVLVIQLVDKEVKPVKMDHGKIVQLPSHNRNFATAKTMTAMVKLMMLLFAPKG